MSFFSADLLYHCYSHSLLLCLAPVSPSFSIGKIKPIICHIHAHKHTISRYEIASVLSSKPMKSLQQKDLKEFSKL